MPAKVMFSTLV